MITESVPWQKRAYIVGEIGLNHNGRVADALRAIEIAYDAGCDAVKFQTFRAEEICVPGIDYEYMSQGVSIREPQIDMFRRSELPDAAWPLCVDRAQVLGIDFFTTPQNIEDLRHFDVRKLPAIKIGSDDLTNLRMLQRISELGRPVILSSGMAKLADVSEALSAVGWPVKRDVAVLVCTSEYPASLESLNLRRLSTLSGAFPGLSVGFSDHSQDLSIPACAVALGAKIFEKHFTLDKGRAGPDHWFSANPDELHAWVQVIRNAEKSLGTGIFLPTEAESGMAEIARRSISAVVDIPVGVKIEDSMIGMRRPGTGLSSKHWDRVIGSTARREIGAYETISWDMLTLHHEP